MKMNSNKQEINASRLRQNEVTTILTF